MGRAAPGGIAVQHVGQAAHAHLGGEAGGVDLLGRRGEQQVHALGLGQLGVALLVARVGVQVLVRAELGRVHEQRHHDHVVLGAGGRISDRWPSWKKPMVGTRPIVRPAARSGARARAQLGDGAHGPHAASGRQRSRAVHHHVEQAQQLRRGVGHRGALRGNGLVVAARDRAGQRFARGPERPSSRRCCAPAAPAAAAPDRVRARRRQRSARRRPRASPGSSRPWTRRRGRRRGPRRTARTAPCPRSAPVPGPRPARRPTIPTPRSPRSAGGAGSPRPVNVCSGCRPNWSAPAPARAPQRRGAAGVADQRGGSGDCGRRGLDLGVRHAQQSHIGPGRLLTTSQRTRDLVTRLTQGGRYHPAEATGTHNAHALGGIRLIFGDRFHRPAGPAAGAAGRQ